MVNLLYISGSGRSGSTLVERILNSAPTFVAVGEFHVLWRLDFAAITCSCGAQIGACDFWTAVLARAGIGAADIAGLKRAEALVARSGRLAAAGFALPRLAADPQVAAFLAPQFAIFEAVSALAGKPVVVDSSKAGPRAWIVATDPRSHLMHIYRDPGDVIASWRSRKFDQGLGTEMARPSVASAAADWWKVEQLARRLARQHRVAMLDYRALCAAPRPVLAAALAAAGIGDAKAGIGDADAGIAWAGDHAVTPGDAYHSLNGNPDRFDRGTITIAPRAVDWTRYGTADRLAIQAVGAGLRLLYPPRG